MNAVFVHSHIFFYTDELNVYSEGKLPYGVWKRYLKHFSNLTVIGRGKKINLEDSFRLDISSGERVKHLFLPRISDPTSFLKNRQSVNNKLKEAISKADVLIARMPSEYSVLAIKYARKLNKPYIVECVGDVFSSLWYHGNPIGKILAPVSYIQHRNILKDCPYIVYVTKNYLQKRYPQKKGKSVSCSNVEINSVEVSVLKNKIKMLKEKDKSEKIKIGLIGSYSSKYKGIDVAIKALKILRNKKYDVELNILGSGNSEVFTPLIDSLELRKDIKFVGSLPHGEEVFKWLDTLDLYIQPSKTEGLPRALIEAMSRGCPTVASNVGGIPELIDKEFIHSPSNVKELSNKIEGIINNKEVSIKQANINFNRAKDYYLKNLSMVREEFFDDFIESNKTKI